MQGRHYSLFPHRVQNMNASAVVYTQRYLYFSTHACKSYFYISSYLSICSTVKHFRFDSTIVTCKPRFSDNDYDQLSSEPKERNISVLDPYQLGHGIHEDELCVSPGFAADHRRRQRFSLTLNVSMRAPTDPKKPLNFWYEMEIER